MKRLKVYFFTIFIMMASPALASTSNYDELRNDVTSCVESKKQESTAPETDITNRTRELKNKKLKRPIEYEARFTLNNNVRDPIFWDCSINAQPNAIIDETIIKVTPVARSYYRATTKEKEKCINEILRKTATDDWYVSECLSRKIKRDYDIQTVDDYYTKIYQTNNESESEPESEPDSESTDTAQQQINNTGQSTPTVDTNNNSTSSKISVTVSDYYDKTGIENITVCNNNNCKQSDKNGKVTFTATTPQNIRIQGASEYDCKNPEKIIQSAMTELDVALIESTSHRPTGIKNSQHQFVIKCRKLCTDEDLQKLNKGLKEQNKIKKCFKKNKREYEITECKYPESKLDNNQCKLYSNDITITGEGIDIKDVEISLGKNKSKFKPAAEKDAKGQTITIKDIDLDETKYISAKHGNQMITCEFKFRNNTICDFGSLNNNTIEEKVSPATSNTSAKNNDDQQKIQDEEQIEENDSSDIINNSTPDNESNNTEIKDNQQQNPHEKETNEQSDAIKKTITEEQYEQIEIEINKIRTDIKEKIESQCPSKRTDQKCKNKNKIIKQIDEAAKKTLKELNGAWK